MSLASFVLSLIGLLAFPILSPLFTVIVGVLAAVLGGVALSQIRKGQSGGKWFAVIGLGIGLLILVMSVVGLIIRTIGWLG